MESSFRALYYFIVAAEEMNFTRAARKLYITQQSLSKHIKNLEMQYEVRLFERQPTLRLTLAGEQLLKYARRMIRDENKLFNSLKSESGAGKIRLSVGLPSMRGSAYLPGIIEAYHGICPNVVPSYHADTFAAVNSALRTGDIDLYFSSLTSAGKYGRRVAFARDEIYFVISEAMLRKQHPDTWQEFTVRWRDGITVADTAEFPLILPPADTRLRSILDYRYERAGRVPNALAELAESSIGLEMCVWDFFAAFMSKSMLFRQHQLMQAPIYAVRVTDLPEPSWLGIVYSESDTVPDYVMQYIDCAGEVIRKAGAGMDEYLASLAAVDRLLPLGN